MAVEHHRSRGDSPQGRTMVEGHSTPMVRPIFNGTLISKLKVVRTRRVLLQNNLVDVIVKQSIETSTKPVLNICSMIEVTAYVADVTEFQRCSI